MKYTIDIKKRAEKFIVKLPKPEKKSFKSDPPIARRRGYKAAKRQEKQRTVAATCGRLQNYLHRGRWKAGYICC